MSIFLVDRILIKIFTTFLLKDIPIHCQYLKAYVLYFAFQYYYRFLYIKKNIQHTNIKITFNIVVKRSPTDTDVWGSILYVHFHQQICGVCLISVTKILDFKTIWICMNYAPPLSAHVMCNRIWDIFKSHSVSSATTRSWHSLEPSRDLVLGVRLGWRHSREPLNHFHNSRREVCHSIKVFRSVSPAITNYEWIQNYNNGTCITLNHIFVCIFAYLISFYSHHATVLRSTGNTRGNTYSATLSSRLRHSPRNVLPPRHFVPGSGQGTKSCW